MYSGAPLTADQYLVQKFTTNESGYTTSEVLDSSAYTLSCTIAPGVTEQFTQIITITDSNAKVDVDQTVSSVLYSDGIDGSITVHYDTAGTNFSIYKIADISIGDSGLEKLNTNNVTNTSYMFWDYFSLTSLNMTKFNTLQVEDMTSMFSGFHNLRQFTIGSKDSNGIMHQLPYQNSSYISGANGK